MDRKRPRTRESRFGRGVAAGLATILGAVLLAGDVPDDAPAPTLAGAVRAAGDVTGTVTLGNAAVHLRDTPRGLRLVVSSPRHGGRVAWASRPGRSIVAAARSAVTWRQSHVALRQQTRWGATLTDQVIARRQVSGETLVLSGTLHGSGVSAPYRLALTTDGPGLVRMDVDVGAPDDGRGPVSTVVLHGDRRPGEEFHGFGEQFAPFDLAGREVPIVVREQGVGRGEQPITWLADTFRAGAGGDRSWTYAAMPFYVTSELRGLFLGGPTASAYSVFDLSRPGVTVRSHARTLRAHVLVGDSPAELLREHTAATGRMDRLPEWTGRGAVVGVQGGSERVRRVVDRLRDGGTRLAAVWIQDWCGQVRTSFGQRLRWNWEVDRSLYPDWEELVGELRARGIRVLTYANPYLAKLPDPDSADRHLFAEAKARGYLVRSPEGGPYLLDQGGFEAAPVDFTNPEARRWYARVLAEEVDATGVSGWMADFGAMLPYDAVLANGEARLWHNRYPAAWAGVNERACERAGSPDCVVFFRGAFSGSPARAPLFWTGDQLVTWSDEDGLASALAGMLSGGVSGMTLTHTEAGGYTTLNTPVRDYHRSSALLRRWTELTVFGVFLRTHEGNRPRENVQVYDRDEVGFFARMTGLYAALAPYRERVVGVASRTGMPAIRHTWLMYPHSPAAETDRQFFFGPKLLVVPVLEPAASSVRAHLPAGEWVHVWSGRTYGQPDRATRVRIPAPPGRPAVLYPAGDPVGERLAERLRAVAPARSG